LLKVYTEEEEVHTDEEEEEEENEGCYFHNRAISFQLPIFQCAFQWKLDMLVLHF
jgi:hypothetical protein